MGIFLISHWNFYLLVKHPVNLSLMLKLHCLLFELVTIIKTLLN